MTAIDLAALYSALDSVSTVMSLSSRDWSRHADDAWLYGIFCGWDDDEGDATDLIASRFGWDAARIERLRTLRASVKAFDLNIVGDLLRHVETENTR